MAHVRKQRAILLMDRLPIVAVEFRIVKVLPLDAPVLAINLFPLGARIDAHFELGHVQWTITDLDRRGSIGRHDSPTVRSNTLIKQLLLVVRERVRTNAFEKWR